MSFKIVDTEYFQRGEGEGDNTIESGEYFTIEWNANPLGYNNKTPGLINKFLPLDMTYGDGLTGRNVNSSASTSNPYSIIYLYLYSSNDVIKENTDLNLKVKYCDSDDNSTNHDQYFLTGNSISNNTTLLYALDDDESDNYSKIRITSNMRDLESTNPIDTRKKYFIYSVHNIQKHFLKSY